MLFPVEQQTSGRAQILVTRPLVNWKDALADLTIHSRLVYHLTSEVRMDAFVCTMAHPNKRVDMSLSTAIHDEIVADIKKSKFFSVSADEVTDVSNWEQLGSVPICEARRSC